MSGFSKVKKLLRVKVRCIAFLCTGLLLFTVGCEKIGNEENAVTAQASASFGELTEEPSLLLPEVTPNLSPPASGFAALSEGMQSADVSLLQARLTLLGYMRCDAPTGYYGRETAHAVTLFERQYGLFEDGAAGEEVLLLLFSEEAEVCQYPLAGYVIGLDPGHQSKANSSLEAVAPGSSTMKKKVSSGTQGRWSGVPEYKINLSVGLLLRDLLEEQGAIVVMTRETNDVNISNRERAEFFNENETDYALRLHCNGTDDASEHGAFMLVPTENSYLDQCNTAAELLLAAYCEETGAKNRGITIRSDQTGFNWCRRMIINIEMGYMTNKQEDLLLTDSAYQKKMARGLLNGILRYFENIVEG